MPRLRTPLAASLCYIVSSLLLGACSSAVENSPGASAKDTGKTATTGSGTLGRGTTTTVGSGLTGIAGAGSNTCAKGRATTLPVTPTVWLVVDGSGSMGQRFANSTRWDALRTALMDPGGVVSTLEKAVRFGLVIYNGPDEFSGGGNGGNGGTRGGGACFAPDRINPSCLCFSGFEPFCCQAACGASDPMAMPMPAPAPTTPADPAAMPQECANLMVVNPALSNYAAINSAYPQREVGGSTPTHRALERIVSTLPVTNSAIPDDMTGPVYVILATDGAPNDSCAGGFGGSFDPETAKRVVEVVTSGVAMGMRMFVISLAGDDLELRQHLQEVANIGSPGQAPFEPASKDELVTALRNIIGGATCQVALDGTVMQGEECSGQVSLNGQFLTCNVPNGWKLADDHTLQLTGTACDTFLGAQSAIEATFPCNVFVPQ